MQVDLKAFHFQALLIKANAQKAERWVEKKERRFKVRNMILREAQPYNFVWLF